MDRTREKRDADLRKLSEEAFAEHMLASKVGLREMGLDGAGVGLWRSGRIYLRRPGSSFYATEIVWCRYGRLLVHGDIQPCLFAIHEPDMRSAVHVLADAHIDYVAWKCAEGERRSRAGHDVDRGVMLEDLRQEAENPDESIGAVREARSLVHELGDVDGAKRVLHAAGFDGETLAHMGRVVDARVYYAQAALKRLVALDPHTHGEERKMFYIWCREPHDWALWWGPDRNGYTFDLNEAGLYTEAEARAIVRNRPDLDAAIREDHLLGRIGRHVSVEKHRDVRDLVEVFDAE